MISRLRNVLFGLNLVWEAVRISFRVRVNDETIVKTLNQSNFLFLATYFWTKKKFKAKLLMTVDPRLIWLLLFHDTVSKKMWKYSFEKFKEFLSCFEN